MIIDVHCHYVFTGRTAAAGERFNFEPPTRDDGTPAVDAIVSARAAGWWSSWALRRLLGVDPALAPGGALDTALTALHERHLLSEGPIERFVLLAFDAYHDNAGRTLPWPASSSHVGSDLYTSNSLVAELCRRRPDRFLLGASVHPYRRGAVDCLTEVFEAGACLLKWLPLHQNIDVADARSVGLLRCCAALGLPLLVHYGPEFTLSTNHPEHASVTALLDVLRRLRREGAMPTVIVAHAATPITPFGPRGSFEALLEALDGEFADAPLYADVSALTALGKIGFMYELARRVDLHHKLLFGSDYPIPIGWPLLGLPRRVARRIRMLPSWPQQMVHILRHVGFSEIVFHRAAELLPLRGAAARGPG
ncbi:MAG TPA: amidohydrolase family protein [Phycisphaerae bacterium]|nr:amidohydrolase family protein [Phycisphaerae bacterium]